MATAEKLRNLADCSSIELTVISCKDLKAFNFFQKLPVYAAVSIFNDEMKKEEQQKHLQRQKTPVDKEGVGNPEWNHTVQFDMKRLSLVDKFDHLFIKFDMRCEGIIFGEKSLGKVQVPFSDLIDDQFTDAVRFVSYQIRTSDGKANGVLNFSYKVIRKNNNNNISNRSSISSSRSINIGNHDSPESDSSSELTIAPVDSADKVQSLYPTLELENLSRDISYPSLVDVTPLPRIPVPSAKFDFQWRPESSNMSLPPVLPFSAPAAAPASVCCHQWQHLRFVQSPGAHWYPPEFANHGGIFCGNNWAGAGQFGMKFDHNDSWRANSPGKRSDVLPHLGTSTNGGCS